MKYIGLRSFGLESKSLRFFFARFRGDGVPGGTHASISQRPAQDCKGPVQARQHGADRSRESEEGCDRGHQKFNKSNAKPHAAPNAFNPNRAASGPSPQHCRATGVVFRWRRLCGLQTGLYTHQAKRKATKLAKRVNKRPASDEASYNKQHTYKLWPVLKTRTSRIR